MINNLPPFAGPVDASGEPDLWKLANDYWERDTDADAKAFAETPVIWLMDFAKLVLAAASVPSPDITATLRTLAIYCFQKHGNDAYLYNALADLVGPEAMRGVQSSPRTGAEMNNRRPVYPGRKPSTDELSLATFEGATLAKLNRAEALRLAYDILDLFDALPPSSPAQPVTFSTTTVDGNATAAPGTPFNSISTIASGVGSVFDANQPPSSPVADSQTKED